MSTFQLPALREKLTAEAVEKYLADIKTPASEFTSICLSDKSYGLEAAQALAPVLAQMTNLTHADLSDIIAAQHEDIAKQVMRTITEPLAAHSSLTLLDMSNNAMGLKGVVAIERLLCERRDTLQHVYMNNCGNEADAVEHLGKCILPTPESRTQLRTLHMARNCLIAAGCAQVAKIVARSPLLRDLRVSGTRVPSKGAQALVETLSSIPELRLRSLDLSDNSFESTASSSALAHLLRGPQCSELQHLNLSMCQLATRGLRIVCRALRHSRAPLLSLDLSTSDSHSSASACVAACLLSKPTLQSVSLDDNCLRHAGGDLIFRALGALPALRTVSLNGTQLKATSVPALCKMLQSMSAHASASASTATSPLRVSVNGNFFTDDALDEIREAAVASGVTLGSTDDNDADAADEEYEEEDDEDDADDDEEEEARVEATLIGAAATSSNAAMEAAAAAVDALAASVESGLKL